MQGEKQLSLVEQFYSEEKVIRLTGAKGKLDWVKINTPEMQADGSVRMINDITATKADFVVSEQDYAGTMRQVMLENISQIASTLPPEVSLRVLTIAMEFSDLPNKAEIVEAFRKITGDRDPSKEPTPEEAAELEQQMAAQAEALQFQREQAMLALEEGRAKVRELNAKAAQLEAQAMGGDEGGMTPEIERAIAQIQSQAADQIDALSEQLRKAQSELANRTLQINRDADSKAEAARIDADAKIRVAEIQDKSNKVIEALERRIEDLGRKMQDEIAAAREEANKKVAEAVEKAKPAEPAPAPAAAPAETKPAQPITLNVAIDAKAGTVKKTMKFETDADGKIIGGTSVEEGEK